MNRLEGVAAAAAQARRELLDDVRVLPDPRLWDRVRNAAGGTQRVEVLPTTLSAITDLAAAARHELEALWRDLAAARRHAADGEWSIGCEAIANRIARLTLLVGPCPWEHVEIGPLADGTYRGLHAALGVDPGIDEHALAEYLTRVSA